MFVNVISSNISSEESECIFVIHFYFWVQIFIGYEEKAKKTKKKHR